MRIGPLKRPPSRQTWRAMAVVAVGALHIGVFWAFNRVPAPSPTLSLPPPFNVILAELVVPPEPPPEPVRETAGGGGAAGAPSQVRPPHIPPRQPPEVQAPPAPAPEPSLIVGLAPEPAAEPEPGPGHGVGPGRGAGPGAGQGDGRGQGDGAGQPPRLVTGPTVSQIRALHPRAALAARRGGRGVIACRIRMDTRLESCRLVEETPPGQGFGTAALQAAPYFRFRPPTGPDGSPRAGQEVTFGIDFGPPPASR